MLPSTPPTHSVVKRVVSNSVNKLPDLMTCPLHKGDQGGNSIELLTERNVKLYTKKKLEELNFLGSDVVALVCEDCRQAGILHQQSAWFKPDKRYYVIRVQGDQYAVLGYLQLGLSTKNSTVGFTKQNLVVAAGSRFIPVHDTKELLEIMPKLPWSEVKESPGPSAKPKATKQTEEIRDSIVVMSRPPITPTKSTPSRMATPGSKTGSQKRTSTTQTGSLTKGVARKIGIPSAEWKHYDTPSPRRANPLDYDDPLPQSMARTPHVDVAPRTNPNTATPTKSGGGGRIGLAITPQGSTKALNALQSRFGNTTLPGAALDSRSDSDDDEPLSLRKRDTESSRTKTPTPSRRLLGPQTSRLAPTAIMTSPSAAPPSRPTTPQIDMSLIKKQNEELAARLVAARKRKLDRQADIEAKRQKLEHLEQERTKRLQEELAKAEAEADDVEKDFEKLEAWERDLEKDDDF